MLAPLALAVTLLGPVRLDTGVLSGSTAGGVSVYRGIPYAAPPVGPNRWKPPLPPLKWTGVRSADSFGADCMQKPYPLVSIFHSAPRPQSEDCLFLNVWTAASRGERRPVMVWIHGGGMTRGSGAVDAYDGAELARKGVVVVTINYRLGAFGFLAHQWLTRESEHRSSGEYGILDQIAALQWVQRNIAAFGGDPRNVTIFGESAGSWSVSILVATPLAKGLFHRAIGESGAYFGPIQKRSGAEAEGEKFAKSLGAGSLADLRSMPAEKILDAPGPPSGPNVDRWVLPDSLGMLYQSGNYNDVPVLIGSNANEMTALTVRALLPKTREAFQRRAKVMFGSDKPDLAEMYPLHSDADVESAWLDVQRDARFTLPMRTWARGMLNGKSKTWLYWFSHPPANPLRNYLGAYHAGEILYVFHNLNSRPQRWTEADYQLSDLMSDYWVSFAKSGNPNHKGAPEWPAYNRDQEFYMDFGDPVQVKQHLLKDQLDFLESHDFVPAR